METTVTMSLEEFDKLRENAKLGECWIVAQEKIFVFMANNDIDFKHDSRHAPYMIVEDLFDEIKRLRNNGE